MEEQLLRISTGRGEIPWSSTPTRKSSSSAGPKSTAESSEAGILEEQGAETDQHRGRMVRSDRQMSDDDTRAYLREQYVAHVGTSDASGWPYVVPLMYVYEAGDLL